MRDRVIFKQAVHTRVPTGGGITTYEEVFRDWTKATPLTSDRRKESNQEKLRDGFQFPIRYRNSPQPDITMIVEYEGMDYVISGIQETLLRVQGTDERKRFWVITAITNSDPAVQFST